MKQKTLVHQVEIGMYVSELDCDWSEVPFEPPFEVQGFVVASQDDLNQIKKYCRYVLVDVPDKQRDVGRKRVVAESIEERSALRNVRYISPHRDAKARRKAKAEQNKKKAASEKRKKSKKKKAKPDLQQTIRVQKRTRRKRKSSKVKWWDAGKSAEGSRAGGQKSRRRRGKTTIRSVEKRKSVKSKKARKRAEILFAGSAMDTPIYPVQCSVEEEIVIARDIVNDTFKVYDNVVHDIHDGKTPNAEAVKQTVKGLVQSVIRNPDALTWLIKMKQQDDYTYYHSMATCVMALTIGRHLGLPVGELNAMGTGTLLQDIGKIAIPKELLRKTGELTSAERQILRKHVETGLKMLDRQPGLSVETIEIVRSHHERHNGSGYPEGIYGESITPTTTIAAMADTFQALTSNRPYRPALTSLDALTKMYELGELWFPQAMVEHLIQCVGPFPIGTFVQLNTKEIAVVTSPNRILQLKPQVMVVLGEQGNRLVEPESLDLSQQVVGDDSIAWKITQVVSPEDYGLDPREFFIQ